MNKPREEWLPVVCCVTRSNRLAAWSSERTSYDAGIKSSYPTLIEVAAGDFRCVWDNGTNPLMMTVSTRYLR